MTDHRILRDRIAILEEVIETAAARGVRDTETMDDLEEAREQLAALD